MLPSTAIWMRQTILCGLVVVVSKCVWETCSTVAKCLRPSSSAASLITTYYYKIAQELSVHVFCYKSLAVLRCISGALMKLPFAFCFTSITGGLNCFGISRFLRQQTVLERTRSYLINYDSFFLTRNYKQLVHKNCALSYPHQAESGLP